MELDSARELANGPHLLHIDRIAGPSGSKKLFATFLTLCNANPEDMHLEPIIQRQMRLSKEHELSINDFFPDKEQRASILHQAAILAVKSLTTHVDGFKEYADHPLFQFTPRRPLPEQYRTRIIPVASTLGAQYTPARHAGLVQEVYLKKLQVNEESFKNRAIPCINDAATNNSIRRIQMAAIKSKKSTPLHSLDFLQLAPGLGDILRKMVRQAIKNHCPNPNSGEGLAGFLKTVNKSYLAQCKQEDHEAALSALDAILGASFLDCWQINSGYPTVDAYAASNPKPEEIYALAKKIVIKHLKRIVPKQPERFSDDDQYSDELSDEEVTDEVYDNQRLLLRDIAYIVMLKSAIADADFGRVEDFLGIIAVTMMGAGMENTSEELMHFIQNLKHVWPENFANIMRDSMIVSYFKRGSNAQPADVSVPQLGHYSRFFYAGQGFEHEWRAPKSMAEAIALVDAYDEKLEVKDITERIANDGECCVM